MAFGIYVGVDSKARKVSKLYVGVGGKARRIIKAYVGVGGVARLCYTSTVSFYSTQSLSVGRDDLAATTIGNYALFGGGESATVSGSTVTYTYYTTVDAYNTSLTRSAPTALSTKRSNLAATTVGNYALFAGGQIETKSGDTTTNTYYATVDAYNASLTRSTPTALSTKREGLGATKVGNYALFAGGYPASGSYAVGYNTDVNAYNTSLTRSTPTSLSKDKGYMGAATVGNYALFAGGASGIMGYTDVVDAYNASLTRSTPTVLSQSRGYLTATTVGNYALFAGGFPGFMESSVNVVDAYNTSLTRSTPTALSSSIASAGAATVNNYAIFPNGQCTDVYDTSLTKISMNPSGSLGPGTSVGKYALFAPSSAYSTDVKVYISG